MRAITQRNYGGPEVLRLEELPMPEPGPKQVLVRVVAATLNPADWHLMTGTPYILRLAEGLRRPARRVLGSDLSGVIEAVGPDAGPWNVGDEVFGYGNGAAAEYAVVDGARLAAKPPTMSFAEAAGLPIAGVTALQAVVERGRVTPDDRVLVNGASGGVGTYAVQLAVAAGAHVTGVCSSKNQAMVTDLGAQCVVDYTSTPLDTLDRPFDLIIDNVGILDPDTVRGLLPASGRWVMVGGPKDGRTLGPVWWMVKHRVAFARDRREVISFIAKETSERLEQLAQQVRAGLLISVVDGIHPLDDAATAMARVGSGRAVGKVVLDIA